jgi:hypothetical protein
MPGWQGPAAERRQATTADRLLVGEHRRPRGIESAQPGPGLIRVERVNPARVRSTCAGMRGVCGRPTVRGAESRWRDRVSKKRMPAAERQQETAGRNTGDSSRMDRRITGRIPGLVPGPERGADVDRWAFESKQRTSQR